MKRKILVLFAVIILSFSFVVVNAQEIKNSDELTAEEDNFEDSKKVEKEAERKAKLQEKIEKKKAELAEKKEEIKLKLLEKAKKRALQKIDSSIKKLTQINERVENMKVISVDQKNELSQKIGARIQVLESKKVAIEAATDKEQIKAALGESIKQIKDTKEIIKNIVFAIHKNHLQNMVAKTETFIAKIEAKSSNLSEEKQATILAAIGEAKNYLTQSRSQIESGELDKAKSSIKSAHKVIGEALSGDKEEDQDE